MVDEQTFLQAAADALGVPPGGLSLETAYESIPQWDSVQHIRLVMELGARFGVDIPLGKIPDLRTLRAFHTLISAQQAGAGA